MKLLKTLTVGALIAATASHASAAPTIIHVVGSTAFRTGTSAAIIDALAGTTIGGTGTTPVNALYDSASVLGAGHQLFANGTIGSSGTATIVVETVWTGSLAGVVDLTTQVSSAAFYDINDSTVISTFNAAASQLNTSTDLFKSGPVAGTPFASTTFVASTNGIQLALSDSNKATIAKELATATLTGSLGSFSSISALASAAGGSGNIDAGTQGEGDVAIVPFEWVLGNITPAGVTAIGDGGLPTNITQQAAAALIGSGSIFQSLLTGLNNDPDTANAFYLVGRNEDSGTRIGAYAESQFGVTSAPVQYQVGDDNTNLSPAVPFPVTALNTEPKIIWNTPGHSGYSSGGNVSTALGIAEDGTTTFTSGKINSGSSFFIGYVGLTDAATAIGKGATALKYNGVAYSPTATQNGQYTFWTVEHAYRTSSESGATLSTVNTIADNIAFLDADAIYSTSTGISHAENTSNGTYISGSAGLFDNGFFNVARGLEGSPIIHQ